MIPTYIYCALMIIMTVHGFIRNRNILAKFLLILFCGSSIFTVLGVNSGIIKSDVTLIPYFFLIIVYALFLSPITMEPFPIAEDTTYEINRKYKLFLVVYIICTIVTIMAYLPSMKELILSGRWSANRNALYAGEIIFPDSNPLVHLASLFSGYMQLLALILGFIMLKRKETAKIGVVTIVLAASKTVCSSIYTSSRGMMTTYALLMIALFLFFFSSMRKDVRKFLTILVILAIAAMVPFMIEVTLDRFGSSTSSINSVIDYLGKAPAAFNYGVFDIKRIMFGDYAFGELFGHNSFSPDSIGGKWGTSFYTFVGYIYIDWGIIGTILWGIIVSIFWSRYKRRANWNISDIYLLISYYYFLLQGVFVIGRSYCYTIVSTLVIYWISKYIFEKYTFVLGDTRLL